MVRDPKKALEASAGRFLVGEVVSDKMDKTVVVKVVRTLRHPLFGKIVRRYKKYKAHDEAERARVGDVVQIQECRPLSKTKYMTLVQVLESSKE